MPIIIKTELKPEISVIKPKKRLLKTFQDQMYGCQCQHLNTGHYLCYGRCYYQYCDCKEFKSLEIVMEIMITNADIFEFENPDHSERDSFAWWNEFSLWRKNNEQEYSF